MTLRGDKPRSVASSCAPTRVAQDFTRGVVPRHAGDATAGMRARTAHVQPLERSPIVAVAEDRSCRKQLVERQRAMKDVATGKAEFALEVKRGKHAARDDACAEAGRVTGNSVEHQIGDLVR